MGVYSTGRPRGSCLGVGGRRGAFSPATVGVLPAVGLSEYDVLESHSASVKRFGVTLPGFILRGVLSLSNDRSGLSKRVFSPRAAVDMGENPLQWQ